MFQPMMVKTNKQPAMFAKSEREKVFAYRTMELARNRWERAMYSELRRNFGLQRKALLESPDFNKYYVETALASTTEQMENILYQGGVGISREVYPMVANMVEKSSSDYDRVIARWLKDYGSNAVVGINDTTRESINDILDRSTTERWSISKTAKELDGLYLHQIIPNRSFVIARTEISGASNMSSQFAMDTIPVTVQKVWTTARDTAVRDSHMDMEGVAIDKDEYFNVRMMEGGMERMLVPADPMASAGNRINCRCLQIYQKT